MFKLVKQYNNLTCLTETYREYWKSLKAPAVNDGSSVNGLYEPSLELFTEV